MKLEGEVVSRLLGVELELLVGGEILWAELSHCFLESLDEA